MDAVHEQQHDLAIVTGGAYQESPSVAYALSRFGYRDSIWDREGDLDWAGSELG